MDHLRICHVSAIPCISPHVPVTTKYGIYILCRLHLDLHLFMHATLFKICHIVPQHKWTKLEFIKHTVPEKYAFSTNILINSIFSSIALHISESLSEEVICMVFSCCMPYQNIATHKFPQQEESSTWKRKKATKQSLRLTFVYPCYHGYLSASNATMERIWFSNSWARWTCGLNAVETTNYTEDRLMKKKTDAWYTL